MRERWWVAYVQGLLAAALLAIPAILNRAPLFYEDTEIYFARPAAVFFDLAPDWFETVWVTPDKLNKWHDTAEPATASAQSKAAPAVAESESDSTWSSGRSIYWSFVAYIAVLAFGVWGALALNALIVGIILAIAWHRCATGLPMLLFPVLVLALGLTTTLGATVALLTPDILAAALIVGMALLAVCWSKLLTIDRIVIALICAFAALSHDSHIALAAGLFVPGVLIAWFRRSGGKGRSLAQIAVLAAPLIVGALGTVVFTKVAEAQTGTAPVRLPHLTAHLTNLDAGSRYLREHCDSADFAVCDYADRLPVHWIAFLFDQNPSSGIYGTASAVERERLSNEQFRFAWAVAREYPVSFATGLVADGIWQTGTFDLRDYDQRAKQNYFRNAYPDPVFTQIRRTMAWNDPELLRGVEATNMAITLVAGIALIGVLLMHLAGAVKLPSQAILFASMILLGLIANAFVCGMLASPLGRFQARIIWLAPFLGFSLLALAVQSLSSRRTGKNHATAG